MKRLFGREGLFYRLLSRTGDLILLNFLFLLCCLPVVTAGASLTALYAVTLKMSRDEESYIAGSFFRAFRENAGRSTRMWLLLLAAALVIAADLMLPGLFPGSVRQVMRLIYTALGLMLLVLAVYAFPEAAYFDNTVRAYLLNAFYLAVRFFYFTVPMTVLWLIPGLAAYVGGPPSGVLLPFYLIIGFAATAYLCSFPLGRVFAYFAKAFPAPEDGDHTDGGTCT